MPERVTDDLLIAAARRGDRQAWAAIYARHQGRAYRFALAMTGSPELAEDAVQDAFLVLLDKLSRFDPARGSLESFLLGVVRNRILRAWRERALSAEDVVPEVAVEANQPLEQEIEMVRQVAMRLPAAYRECLVLCDLEELSYEQAAEVLNCPVGTVRSRLHRGRQMLAERLNPKPLGKGSMR